ncbi:MAG: hypothetical protein R6W90_12530 [Ignavibacteriaceae bacterium]
MKIIPCLIFSLIVISGCSTPSYVADTPHTPLFKKAGEVNAGFSYGLPGIEAKASFSLPANLFLFGGASFLKTDTVNGDRNRIFEGGAGFYQYFDKPVDGPFILKFNHIEFLAGYGSGQAYTSFPGIIDSLNHTLPADYKRYFFQFNIGLSSEKQNNWLNTISTEEMGQTIRFSFVDFYKFSHDNNSISRNLDNLFFEYFFFSRISYGILKLGGTAGVVIPLQNKPEFGGSYFVFSIGAMINFNL